VPDVRHPLDPLTADEIRAAMEILRRERGLTERWRVASIELREPPKAQARDHRPGDPIPRAAVVVCWNRDDGQAYKAVVSLDGDRVAAWEHRPGEQPNMTVDEFREVDAALRAHPDVIAALAERGITDMDLVLMDTWAYGASLIPDPFRGRRVAWTDVWHRAAPAANPYANPVGGLHPIVDLNTMELLDLGDSGVVAAAPTMGEYVPRLVPGLSLRDDVRALHVHQPAGVSFALDGNEVRWQRWSMRIGFTTARAWCCTPSATRTAGAPAPWPIACRSPRWSCPTATRPASTSAAPPSTSASGASGS
jgi:primary-amine oxidase